MTFPGLNSKFALIFFYYFANNLVFKISMFQTIEDGTHEELIKLNGHYAKMWHMQAGGFLPEYLDDQETNV